MIFNWLFFITETRGQAPKGGAPKGGAPMGGGPEPSKSGIPKGGGPKGWGAQNFALFFLSRRKFHSFFSLWGVFSLSPGGHFGWDMALNSGHNSTRRPPRERRMNEIFGGREKKKSEILGGPGEGRSRGRAVRRRGVLGRGPKILNTPTTHTTHTYKQQQTTTGHQQGTNRAPTRHQQGTNRAH